MGILAPVKKINIMGKEFSEEDWRAALKSDKGVFKRLSQPPKNILGPTLTESLDVVGDMGVMEISDINLCTREQQFVFKQLMEQDEQKAAEYAFAITNADTIWKRKIKLLQDLLLHIKSEEGEILNEEVIVEKAEKMRRRLDPELEKYFPADFSTLKQDIADLEKFAADLERVEKHLKSVEKKIREHLEGIQARFPFLFE